MKEYYKALYDSLLEYGHLERLTDYSNGNEAIYSGSKLISSIGMPGVDAEKESIAIMPSIVLFGFGHIGKSIYRILSDMSFPIFIFDDRKEVLDGGHYSRAAIVIDDFRSIFERTYSFENPYFLIFTHGHKADEQALRYVLENYEGAKYVGMIGSRRKINLTYSHLEEMGISRKALEKVHAPIGIDINAETPDEIAISVIAEIIRTYRKSRHQVTVDLSLLKVIDELDGNAVLARIIQKEGSGPREKGAEMLITEKSTYSTIGGGAIEMEAVKEARNMLSSHISFRILDFSLTEDSPLEMACGGNARVMLRTVK